MRTEPAEIIFQTRKNSNKRTKNKYSILSAYLDESLRRLTEFIERITSLNVYAIILSMIRNKFQFEKVTINTINVARCL